MLSVEQLSVTYGPETRALEGVDLTVADGDVVCVLGPSGSGKSTLLRVVAGLVEPTSGRVCFDGADLAGITPHRRNFGLMFQDHALFPHRDVLGNVRFGLEMQARRAEHGSQGAPVDADARARDLLALVGIPDLAHRRIDELSGGEQQRVALARALAPSPRLLMLDEPLGALDRALRERLTLELHELFRELRQTTLFVTHDHDEAFALADRLVVLVDGRVEQVAAPAELVRRPANPVVARFLGWNVTTVFGDECAVPPSRLALRPAGAPPAARGEATVPGRVTTLLRRRGSVSAHVLVGSEVLVAELLLEHGFAEGDEVLVTLLPEA